MPSDLDFLCRRMDQLQRENRSLKRIGLIVLVLMGAGFLMGQSGSPGTVEAESFVLKGSDGSVRAKMDTKDGSTELLLYNASGQPRVTIKVDEGGETFDMDNDSGEPLAMIDVALQKTRKSRRQHRQSPCLGVSEARGS